MTRLRVHNTLRSVGGVLVILALSFLTFDSARYGFSRLLTKYSLFAAANPMATQGGVALAAVDEAIALTPNDPEAHRARAAILGGMRLFPPAETEQSVAVSLRPRDDYLWLELGNLREENDNESGALDSFNEAVNRAPYYGHTRWQRGNVLLRMGRGAEAFDDLRTAARTNRNFIPNFVDLAWELSRRDTKAANDLIQLNDDYTRISFARLLARNGRGSEVLDQLAAVRGSISGDVRKEIVRQLFNAGSYRESYLVWRSLPASTSSDLTVVSDGGFEGALGLDEAGFNWIIARDIAAVNMTQDASLAQSGARSLRITFKGDSPPANSLISQTVLVSPGRQYGIDLAFRTREIVTGGVPTLIVKDPRTGSILNKLDLPGQKDEQWQLARVDFQTPPNCDAIVLSLQRNVCTSAPCPIFGMLWLDSVSIKETATK